MSEVETEIPLRDLAFFAAAHTIRGGSYKRNALLKPLDIILQALDACQHPERREEIELIRAAMKTEILDHLTRIADARFKPGKTKANFIDQYVDLFFDGVLKQMHHGQVSQLLGRERLLRSAYLFWMRQELANRLVARGKAANVAQATEAIEHDEDDSSSEGDVA